MNKRGYQWMEFSQEKTMSSKPLIVSWLSKRIVVIFRAQSAHLLTLRLGLIKI